MKKKRLIIKLVNLKNNKYFYTTTKNKNNNKINLKKFNPYIKKHIIYKEKKIN